MTLARGLVAGCALGLLTSASAMSLREFRALELSSPTQGEAYANYYLVGVMEGVLDTHAAHVRSGAKPWLCQNGRRLEPRLARAMLDAELTRHPDVYEADMGVPLVMRNALATSYPCD